MITDNLNMTSLTWGADKVEDLTVTGNDALTTVNFAGLAGVGADADGTPTLSVYDNALTASAANDTVDGLSTGTQYTIDGSSSGVNNDNLDEGSFTFGGNSSNSGGDSGFGFGGGAGNTARTWTSGYAEWGKGSQVVNLLPGYIWLSID